MSSERDRPTPADYVILALNPGLIMVLVGSLVFFLLEILYAGAYGGNMRWMLFFFVMATVLISRIALTGAIRHRSGAYGAVLGLLVWLSLMKYADYPADSPVADLRGLINVFLIAVVWWCAHKLTRDCTHVEDEADVGGEGLLQAAGFEEGQASQEGQRPEEDEPASWLERWRRYREQRKKKRTPGVWVVWFSLAALPLFGLGQSLIPVADLERRRYAFWLMILYVGSGLGLLLTTSFLGLRRYLRQRKVEMPARLTGVWLSLGGGLVVALLVAGALLPRPQAEYPLLRFGEARAKPGEASQWAQRGGEPGEGKGRPVGDKAGKGEPGPGAAGKDQKKGKEEGGPNQGKGSSTEKGSGAKAVDDQKGKSGSGQRGADGGKENGDKPEAQAKGQNKPQGPAGGQNKPQAPARGSTPEKEGASPSRGSPSSSLLAPLGSLASVLKWLVFGLVALVVLVVLLRGGLQFLANFTHWARRLLQALSDLWASLFGDRRVEAGGAEEEKEEEEITERVRPFSWYRNPFDEGTADGQSPRELVHYTFAALEAWARERGLVRQANETALEFAERVGGEVPALEAALHRLAQLFGQVTYAAGGLPASWREGVRRFWQALEQLGEQSLSAGVAGGGTE